jgi:hypothetical protein
MQKQKLNDYYHAAPITMAIELTDIVRVREFRANRGVGWEGKFGFTIKYKYRPPPTAHRAPRTYHSLTHVGAERTRTRSPKW